MFIYHGSLNIIDLPTYGKGKDTNDYGKGLYCTEDITLAKEWAVKDKQDGYVNSYSFLEKGLSILDLNSEEYSLLNWLAVLLTYRTFEINLPMPREINDYICKNYYVDVNSFDVVRGYRADDSYFSFAKDFINGTISYRQLGEALYLGDLGEQIVLKSKRAFKALEFSSYEKVLSEIWYPRRYMRDKCAREKYQSLKLNKGLYGELFSIDILREEIKPNDPRLR